MSFESDLLLDRRRLRRRLLLWRVLAVAAVAVAVLIALPRGELSGGRRIARLTVAGIITDDRALTRAVTRLADDPSVAALIVSIDSPGGSVSGGEGLHDAIAHVAEHKPVVAVMNGVAASAGYMIAVPAARIFARGATLTGSIGVLLQTGEASGLLNRLGITADAITSGPLKDQPSFTRPLTDEGRAVLHGLVMDLYGQFVDMVAAGRHMTADRVRQLADGRAYTGRQALALGLVDQIGDEQDARVWLAQSRGVASTLPVSDVTTDGWASRHLRASLSPLLATVLSPMLDGVAKTVLSQGVMLDGAVALWQPSSAGGEP